jgi:hypothetical protein
MSRKFLFLMVLVVLVAPFTTSIALAAGERGSNCPPGFTLEMAMHPDEHEHEHMHVGTSADQNNDGYICMKPVTPDESIHVHIDNNVP